PYYRVIIARIIVIQPGQVVVILPGEAFSSVDGALVIARVAIGSEDLVAFERGPVGRIGEAGENTAQRIGHVEDRAVGVQRAEESPTQGVVVGITLVGTRATVEVLLQAEGIHGHGGA